jgi:2-oxoglutarate ferredoxin oxidoreductase subunit beta
MSTTAPPVVPPGDTNRVGLTKSDYEGAKTTLCPGCGHNAITAGIIQAAFESSLEPHRVAKLSGIGCSSKTPAYFLAHSHGFNAVHGRMPSIATGVHAANRGLLLLGVSGDGDTPASGSDSFATWCAATCRWSTSSRTTACTGSPRDSSPPPPTSAAR